MSSFLFEMLCHRNFLSALKVYGENKKGSQTETGGCLSSELVWSTVQQQQQQYAAIAHCTLQTKRQRHAAQTLYCTLLHWSTSVDYILVESYTMPKDQEKELWLHGAALCLPEYIAHVLPGQWTSRNSQTAKLVSIEILQIFFLRFFIGSPGYYPAFWLMV